MLSYEDTAYDSTRPRELPPPLPDQKRGVMARAWLKRKLGPLPVECGEYLTLGNVDGLRLLKKGELDGQVEEYPLQIHWPSRANPLFWIAVFRFWGGFFGTGFLVGDFLFVLTAGHTFSGLTGLGIAGLVVYFVLGLILKADKPTADDNFVLNRRTGMVHLPSGSQPRTIPFDEFAPYLHEYVSPNGFVTWALILGHEYSDFHLLSGDYREKWKVGLEWEYYRQFMDVSKPLPDVPHLEPDRALDPTTAEWDRRMGRPSDFWRSMSEETYEELKTQSAAEAGSFPWGSRRYDAMFAGWQPSCYGIISWWETPEPTSKEESFRHWRRCLEAETMFKEPDPYRVQEYGRLVGLLRGAAAARLELLDMAKSLLADYDLTPKDRERFVSYVEKHEYITKELVADAKKIEQIGPKVAIEDGAADRDRVLGIWINALRSEGVMRRTMNGYELSQDDAAQQAEHAKINLEVILAAVDTLRVAGVTDTKTSPDRVRETIAAFLVSLAQKEGTIRPDELRLLNHALGRENTAEQYIQQYGDKLTGDRAAEDITEMVTRLNEHYNKVAVLVYDYLDAMSRILIHADGDYEVAEWEQLSTLRELVGKALGVEIEALPRPGEVL